MKNIDQKIIDYASYCLNCKNPRCVNGCPIRQNIPRMMELVKNNDGEGAYSVISEINLLGGICGLVCPHEKQCQGHCIRGIKGEPVQIGAVESYVHKNFGSTVVKHGNSLSGKNIAIVGAGPSGLACAWKLIQEDACVTVYEKQDVLGGVTIYGIPPFRLDRQLVENVVSSLSKAGVKFVVNTNVGVDITLSTLSNQFDAVFVANGLNCDYTLGIDGENKKGVILGNDYLKAPYNAKNAIIIGGGNVAIDCARTINKLGANTTIAYRRTYKEMPAFDLEKVHAQNEGVEFKYLLSPKAVIGQDSVTAVEFTVNVLGEVGEDGRATMVATEETLTLPCDLLIVGTGSYLDQNIFSGTNVQVNRGKVVVDERQNACENIFAGGDNINRVNTVVQAVVEGKTGAEKIKEQLTMDN